MENLINNIDVSPRVQERRKIAILFTFVGGSFLLLFSVQSLLKANYDYAAFLLSLFAAVAINLYFLIKSVNPIPYVRALSFAMGLLFVILLFTGGVNGTGILWFYVFPILVFFLLGTRDGFVAISIVAVLSGVFVVVNGLPDYFQAYPKEFLGRLLASLISTILLAYFYENSREKRMLELTDLRDELQKHKDTLELQVKERTKELEFAKLHAEKANLSKSQFLANMSHELRTPMHAILSFTDLAAKHVDHEKASRFLQNIKSSGIRLTHLLNDLLDLSKLESGKKEIEAEQSDMHELIEASVSEVNSLIHNKGIQLSLDLKGQLDCWCDRNLISQVIINFLSNAIKFSPEKSEIVIQARQIKKAISDSAVNYIQVCVIDSGVGIPSSEIDEIFEHFVQSSKTKHDKTGTGLGLSISKQIINLHNGFIWAESPPSGKSDGTAFVFEIPVEEQLNSVINEKVARELIKIHLDWKQSIDLVFLNNEIPVGSLYELALNDKLGSLGQWIENQPITSPLTEQLKELNRDFHNYAGKYIKGMKEQDSIAAHDYYDLYHQKSKEICDLLGQYLAK